MATKPGPPTDEDFQPPVCQFSQTGEEYNSAVSIAFIDVGDNAGLVRTVMSDGTITLTATDGGSVGASGGLGAEFAAGGGAELGASVDFGGGVTLGVGDSWSFSGQDAQAEVDSFEELLNEHRTREKLKRYGGQGVWTADLIDPLDPLPEPDSTTTSVGLEGDVAADVGVKAPSGSGPAIGVDGFAGSIAGDANWTHTRDTNGTESIEDDTKTSTVDMSINPDVSSDVWQADMGLGETHGMSMAITQDLAGRITEIAIVTTSEGAINGGVALDGGGIEGAGSRARGAEGSFLTSSEATTATVTTTTLALDPDAPGYTNDVAVVEDWLGGTGYEWPGGIPMRAVNPAIEGDDPFSELMHEQATVSAVTSEGVTSTSGLAAEVAVGSS